MQDPSRSRFLRLVGPPGTGKSQIARAIAYRLWTRRGRAVETRHGEPFYGYVEMSGGPSSDEFTFSYEYVPDSRAPRRRAAHPRRVRRGDAARLGGDDRRGQHDPRRRAARPQRARSTAGCRCTCPPRAAPSSPAPGFAVLIAYNPGLVGASRHPRRLALALPRHRRGHQQLAGARQARRRRAARRRPRWRSTPSASTPTPGSCGRRSSATSRRSAHMIELRRRARRRVAVHQQPARADRGRQGPGRRGRRRRADARRGRPRPPEGRRRRRSPTCTATRAR